MATTARLPIKPKTLTLFDICQSMHDFRQSQVQPAPPPLPPPPVPPLPNLSHYYFQPATQNAQIFTRRLYLHPLPVSNNPKRKLPKIPATETILSDVESRSSVSVEKKSRKNKLKPLPEQGLAVLSNALPLTARIHGKIESRHHRDKSPNTNDTDSTSDHDLSSTSSSSHNRLALPPINRRGINKTGAASLRPSCILNQQKPHSDPNRWKKARVWFNIDQVLQRPLPNEPPATPLTMNPDFDNSTLEREPTSFKLKTIQEIKIYKRNKVCNVNVVIDDDDPVYDENLFL